MPRPEVTLVIPIYNEAEVLAQLDARVVALLETLATATEVVFVDDGSSDGSLELLRTMVAREPRYRVVSFSRNFGHQRAITAGMEASRGKAVVVMDADLQDPPEVVVEMVAKWREGYDVVYGRRRSRQGETWFKLFTAKVFYRLFAAMIPIDVPLDAGDFRLMSRRVVLTLSSLGETHRFVRGLVSWVGFRQIAVEYDRSSRAAGTTKYPLKKMLSFAMDGIASFSILPLRLATYLGLLGGALSILYTIVAIIVYFMGLSVVGWTTLVGLLSFLFSVQLLVTGVLGEYVGRIYEQVKGRPLYVVAERIRHKPMRKRAETQDFGSVGEAIKATVTDRPPMGAPPPAPGAAPMPSSKPPPVASSPASVPSLAAPPVPSLAAPSVPSSKPPPVTSSKPPPVTSSPASVPPSKPPVPSSKPASLPPKGPVSNRPPPVSASKPPPPLPSAAKKTEKA